MDARLVIAVAVVLLQEMSVQKGSLMFECINESLFLFVIQFLSRNGP